VRRLTGQEVAWAAQLACLYEASAAKPGNVSPRAAFDDVRFEDFAAAAIAVGPAFAEAGRASVGETVLRAVVDTRRLVATNVNLGIVLLLAPLARAAADLAEAPEGVGEATAPDAEAEPADGPEPKPKDGLRDAVVRVLGELTVEDAELAYEAIRMASPAGMGQVDQHDVGGGPVLATLHEAMALARDRDAVAREYATGFEITFTLGYPSLQRAWHQGCAFADAVVTTFLTILAEVPDTLIARKNGARVAADVSARATAVLAAGGCLSPGGREQLGRFARELRDPRHALNPGTTADLVAAALFVFLTEGGMLDRVPDLAARWRASDGGGDAR
jgi:triphosphoribosyl-dephospho-CoA synthase